MDKKFKVGIMGGTFDPIHVGHLILGETAYEQFGLDRVLFMPAGNPPHKKNRVGRATDDERLEMVHRAIESNPHFELSLAEMHPDGYSYTYRTLEFLKKEYPVCEYYFIIGADSLFDFDQWREPGRICAAAKIVVATRNHTSDVLLDQEMERLCKKYQGSFLKLESLNIDISSNMLRSFIRENRTIKYYVPDSVITYISEKNMYREEVYDG